MRCSASRLFSLLATLAVLLSVSCGKQDPVPDPDPPEPVDPNPPSVYKYGLRELARANDLLLGTAFTYSEYNMDQPLKEVLKRDFDAVTFGNEMKHDGIVQADGSLRFQTADTMVGWLKDCDAQLFGHTLGWHSQQQTDYLDKMIREAPDGSPVEVRSAALSAPPVLLGSMTPAVSTLASNFSFTPKRLLTSSMMSCTGRA